MNVIVSEWLGEETRVELNVSGLNVSMLIISDEGRASAEFNIDNEVLLNEYESTLGVSCEGISSHERLIRSLYMGLFILGDYFSEQLIMVIQVILEDWILLGSIPRYIPRTSYYNCRNNKFNGIRLPSTGSEMINANYRGLLTEGSNEIARKL